MTFVFPTVSILFVIAMIFPLGFHWKGVCGDGGEREGYCFLSTLKLRDTLFAILA